MTFILKFRSNIELFGQAAVLSVDTHISQFVVSEICTFETDLWPNISMATNI